MANKTSKGQEGYYASYKAGNKQAKNRKIKLERQLKKQPNNEQVALALKNIMYRRKTPKTPFWSHSMINQAKLIKEFTGHFNPKIFDSNLKVASEALSTLPTKNTKFKMDTSSSQYKHMFSIGARVGWTF